MYVAAGERPSEVEKPAIQLVPFWIGIWFLVQKIQSWCELNGSWLTDTKVVTVVLFEVFFFFFGSRQQQTQTLNILQSYSLTYFCFVSFCVDPREKWVSSSCVVPWYHFLVALFMTDCVCWKCALQPTSCKIIVHTLLGWENGLLKDC